MSGITWDEAIAHDGAVSVSRIRREGEVPSRKLSLRKIRLPKGASWIRFDDDPSTHLLYQGIRWGYVYKPKPRENLKSKTRYKWISENVRGGINWGRTRDEALRLLVRTLRVELKLVQVLASPVATSIRHRKLSRRDILRWGDEYQASSGKWLPVYGPATGSNHTVGMHPYRDTEYRRPIKEGGFR